jgi:hypothetical protein
VLDLTLGMENLYWTVRPKKSKAVTHEDIIHAFTKYRASEQRGKVHMKIRDFIGDENVCLPCRFIYCGHTVDLVLWNSWVSDHAVVQ